MRQTTRAALLVASVGVFLLDPKPYPGQARQKEAEVQPCRAEEGMVEEYRKSITELAEKVRQESLDDFRKAHHQKSCLTMLTLCDGMLNGVLECLDKAAKDRAATSQQRKDCATRLESYTALKARVERYQEDLKASEATEDAKALIEKLDLSK